MRDMAQLQERRANLLNSLQGFKKEMAQLLRHKVDRTHHSKNHRLLRFHTLMKTRYMIRTFRETLISVEMDIAKLSH